MWRHRWRHIHKSYIIWKPFIWSYVTVIFLTIRLRGGAREQNEEKLENGSRAPTSLLTYAIYTSYDCKFYFWFSHAKIFEIRLRKIFKWFFSQKCVGGIKISTSNSNSASNSASDCMWWYGVYIRFVSVFTEYSILRLRSQYFHANRR